jgi:hypothetical protein
MKYFITCRKHVYTRRRTEIIKKPHNYHKIYERQGKVKLLVKTWRVLEKVSFRVFEHNISFSVNSKGVLRIGLYSYKSVNTFCKEQCTVLGRLRALWRQERKKNERWNLFFWDGHRFVLHTLPDVSKNCTAFIFMMVTKVNMKALRYFEKPGRRNVSRPNHFF